MKRIFDVLLSSLALLLLSPLLIIIAAVVKLESSGPIFYKQKRLGKDGSIFLLLKFRSMTDTPREHNQQILSGSSGVTRTGNIIRRFKIDELPQLLNVLKGDMSFVGPRPCLPSLRESFNSDGEKRLLVSPGLTGLAQINGNIFLSWEERWAFDREYVETKTFMLDLKIMALTLPVVVFGEKWGCK